MSFCYLSLALSDARSALTIHLLKSDFVVLEQYKPDDSIRLNNEQYLGIGLEEKDHTFIKNKLYH